MKSHVSVVVALLFPVASAVTAQDAQQQPRTIVFPTLTVDQHWARATTLMTSFGVGALAFAKAHGFTAEAYGREMGKLFAPGWGAQNTGTALRLARGMQNNWSARAGAKVEVLSVNDTSITMRVAREWRTDFGATKQSYGVTLDEYEATNAAFYDEIAKYLGLRYEQRMDSASLIVTINGHGKDASPLAFPRGIYSSVISPADIPNRAELAGTWEATYAPNNRITVRKDGAVVVEGDYELSFDEIVVKNETGSKACSGPGRYRWTANPTTHALSLGRLVDDCDGRYLVFTRRALTKK
jgi:hypothetical protein